MEKVLRAQQESALLLSSSVGRLVHFLGALLLLALGYLVCFRLPLVDISHLIFGGSTGDPGLYAYLTERHIRFSFTGVHPWYEVGSFYPFAMSGAYSDNYLLPAFLTKAITSFGVSFEGAYNLSLCFAFLANGLSAFFLLRALKISFGWAVCGALAFMCAPKLAFHFGHPQLQWAFFIPLCFTSCLRFLEKRTWLSAQAIGSCVVLAFLCSAYYGVFAALLATVILALGFLQEKRVSSVINTAKRLFLANVLSLALLIVFAKPYFFVRSELFSPPISIATQQAAKPISYISAPVRNLLWGPLTSAWIKHEDYLFPGALILSFSLWGIFLLIREWTEMAKHHRALRYSHRWFILGVIFTVLGFILSGGITRLIPLSQALLLGAGLWSLLLSSVVALRFSSDVSIKKFREGLFLLVLLVFFLFTSFGSIGRAVDFFPAGGLFPLLYWYFPGMNAIRGLSRIGLIVDLILIIFACRAFQGSKLLQKSKLIVICCFSFLLLEYSFARFPANEEASLVHSHATILSQYADPEDAIVFLPMMTPDDGPAYPRYEVRNMRSVASLMNPVVNGYSGRIPAFHQDFGKQTRQFPSKKSLGRLMSIVGLRYVWFLPNRMHHHSNKVLRKRLKKLEDNLLLVSKNERGDLLLKLQGALPLEYLPQGTLHYTPCASARTLRFELQAKGDALSAPSEVLLKKHTKILSHLALSDNWKEYVVSLEPTVHRVVADTVEIHTKYPQDVLIQNLQISACR